MTETATETQAKPAGGGAGPILELMDLRTYFDTEDGTVKAVDGVNLKIERGETLGIVGESGCGKSVTAYSIMRLIPDPPGRIAGGRIMFQGQDLARIEEPAMRKIRGNDISMIFQEPMTSLNPVYTVGDQIMEAIILHQEKTPKQARELALDMLAQVGIPSPEKRIDNYPHEMSGGMKQRVMIAMALVCKPALLIADEPTTALDVTIQAQILDLMKRLQRERGMSLALITHDLAVVAGMCSRVIVMYAGRIVEEATVDELFEDPRHPYTIALLQSVPRLDEEVGRHLEPIRGLPPKLMEEPEYCPFAPRCRFVQDECWKALPPLEPDQDGRFRACFVPIRAGEAL